MKSGIILSSASFPGVDYMAFLASKYPVEIDLSENYIKQSFRNRFRLITAAGLCDSIIPIKHTGGLKQPMHAVEICYRENWQKQQWRTICSAYGKAPFFIYYKDSYSAFFLEQTRFLADWNAAVVLQLTQDFAVNPPAYINDWNERYPEKLDLREAIHPKNKSPLEIPDYYQGFTDKVAFKKPVSGLDLLFNLGPDAGDFLRGIQSTHVFGSVVE